MAGAGATGHKLAVRKQGADLSSSVIFFSGLWLRVGQITLPETGEAAVAPRLGGRKQREEEFCRGRPGAVPGRKGTGQAETPLFTRTNSYSLLQVAASSQRARILFGSAPVHCTRQELGTLFLNE